MIKFGIELPDNKITEIDFTDLKEGNPGVGGSEYLFALLGLYLNENGKNIDCCIYHYNHNKLPCSEKVVANEYDMLDRMEEDGIDVFVYQVNKPRDWYEKLKNTQLKAMAWAHVYPEYYEQREIIECSNVSRVVFVSKEEYDSYIDSDLIEKSTFIYNMMNTNKEYSERMFEKKEVTYIGSLVPAKGFHVLAKCWKKILEKVPDAQLNVIGTGRVYDRGAKLGRYEIADENYENYFMKFLTTDDGKILPSVHFLGLLGEEKEQIFEKTMVGIVNPTALTETFCMSAIEMELSGVPVVSKKKGGLLDTVKNNTTGFLCKSESEFINNVVLLLKNQMLNKKMGIAAKQYVKNTFEAEIVIHRWIEEIESVYYNVGVTYLGVQNNYFNDYKWVKSCIRFARFTCGFKFLPDFETIKNFVRRFKRR